MTLFLIRIWQLYLPRGKEYLITKHIYLSDNDIDGVVPVMGEGFIKHFNVGRVLNFMIILKTENLTGFKSRINYYVTFWRYAFLLNNYLRFGKLWAEGLLKNML